MPSSVHRLGRRCQTLAAARVHQAQVAERGRRRVTAAVMLAWRSTRRRLLHVSPKTRVFSATTFRATGIVSNVDGENEAGFISPQKRCQLRNDRRHAEQKITPGKATDYINSSLLNFIRPREARSLISFQRTVMSWSYPIVSAPVF